MLLGLRAMVAAGAESVMVLHTSQQLAFEPERNKSGELLNYLAFQDYLTSVQQQGRPGSSVPITNSQGVAVLTCNVVYLHEHRYLRVFV